MILSLIHRYGTTVPALILLTLAGCGQRAGEPQTPAGSEGPPTAGADAATTVSRPAATPRPAAALPGPTRAEFARKVATTDYGDITLSTLYAFHNSVGIPSLADTQPGRLDDATPEQLRLAAEYIGARLAAAAEFEASEPTTLTQAIRDYEKTQRQQLINNYVVEQLVTAKLDPVPESAIQEYYDKHKAEYVQPFQFRMRHLILMTYAPYVVQEGDTLESIAERESGDASKAAMIRSKVEGTPPRREEGKLEKPLAAGEELLVPMDDTRAQEVRGRMEGILKELEQGRKFEELVQQYSESPLKEISELLPTGTEKPQILPEILEAAKQTRVGEVSGIFRTRHGWQVIQVVHKIEEGLKSLDEVRTQITQRLQEDQQEELIEKMYETMMAQPGFTVDHDLISSSALTLEPTATVARVGDVEIPWSNIRRAWMEGGQPREEAQIRRFFQDDRQTMEALLGLHVAADLQDEASPLAQLLNNSATANFGAAWIGETANQRARAKVTEETVREYYDTHQDEFKVGERVKLTVLERRLSPRERELSEAARDAALQRLLAVVKEDLTEIKTADEFRSRAGMLRVLIEGPEPALAGTTPLIEFDLLPDNLKEQIGKLEPGKWGEPFAFDDKSGVAILLDERAPAQVKPFEEVAESIRERLVQQTFATAMQEVQREYVQKANVRMVTAPAGQ